MTSFLLRICFESVNILIYLSWPKASVPNKGFSCSVAARIFHMTNLAEGCLIQGSRQSSRCHRYSWFQWRWLLAVPCGSQTEGIMDEHSDNKRSVLNIGAFLLNWRVVFSSGILRFMYLMCSQSTDSKNWWLLISSTLTAPILFSASVQYLNTHSRQTVQ